MWNNIILALVAIFSTMSLFAQKKQDVLFLENGSIIRGDIQVDNDFSKIRILTYDGSIWVFDTADVAEIKVLPKFKPGRFILPKDTGFYNITDFGLLVGNAGYYLNAGPSLQTINGFQFDPKFGAGVGVGLEYVDMTILPVFLEARYNFIEGKTFTPFASVQTGYALPLENYRLNNGKLAKLGGVMLGSQVGIRKYIGDRFGLVFTTGYRFQYLLSYYDNWDWWTGETRLITRKGYYHRMTFRVGFLFN